MNSKLAGGRGVAGYRSVRDILKKMPRPLTLRFRLLGFLPVIFFWRKPFITGASAV